MNLVPKEILMSHLKRSEGAEEVSLPIDFFRDLLYQAMPRTWVGLTEEEIENYYDWEDFQIGCGRGSLLAMICDVEAKLKEKNNAS
jgi:hypothetical protein